MAAAALMATGLEVSKPVTPESYDLSTRDPRTGETKYYQVKTANYRKDRGYVVVDATKGKNGIYSKSEVDYIVGVYKGKVYVFDNREIKEYWVKPDELGDRWTLLDANIKDVGGLLNHDEN
jgi:hypothetical protein